MKCDKHTMLLYAVTDRAWTGRETLRQQVEDALKGGVSRVVQLLFPRHPAAGKGAGRRGIFAGSHGAFRPLPQLWRTLHHQR